jgi:hypothetical protein
MNLTSKLKGIHMTFDNSGYEELFGKTRKQKSAPRPQTLADVWAVLTPQFSDRAAFPTSTFNPAAGTSEVIAANGDSIRTSKTGDDYNLTENGVETKRVHVPDIALDHLAFQRKHRAPAA